MYVCFEIFQRESNGSVLWIGSASSKERAEQAVADAMKNVPSDYLIFRSDTLETEIISPEGRMAGFTVSVKDLEHLDDL